MRKVAFALASLLFGALTANADSLVTTSPTGTDSVDWSQLGTPGTPVPTVFTFTTANGVSGTGTYENPAGSFAMTGPTGEVLQNGWSATWNGNFADGAYVNWTENSGPLTLSFAQGYSQIGAQIQADFWGSFTAQICDANACFTEDGVANGNDDDSAIYLGIAGSDLTSVTFSITNDTAYLDDFAINGVTLDGGSAATPEPSSLLLLGTGLVGIAGLLRGKFARKTRA
jgi:hypothetical protein